MKEDNPDKEENREELDWREYRYSRRKHQHGVLGGVILLLIGVVFLLNNFGILPWQVWNVIWRFWPLILVVWGFEVIFGRALLGRIVVSFISLLLAAFVLVYAVSVVNPFFAHWIQSFLPGWTNLLQTNINTGF